MSNEIARMDAAGYRIGWEDPARIQVNRFNGKTYLQIDQIGDRTKEPFLGTQKFFPFNEQTRAMSLDQIIALYKVEQQHYEASQRQSEAERQRLEQQLRQELLIRIANAANEDERNRYQCMLKRLTG